MMALFSLKSISKFSSVAKFVRLISCPFTVVLIVSFFELTSDTAEFFFCENNKAVEKSVIAAKMLTVLRVFI